LQSSRATQVPNFPGENSHLCPKREHTAEAAVSPVPDDVRSDLGHPLRSKRTEKAAANSILRGKIGVMARTERSRGEGSDGIGKNGAELSN
jgi:hypothetical protein